MSIIATIAQAIGYGIGKGIYDAWRDSEGYLDEGVTDVDKDRTGRMRDAIIGGMRSNPDPKPDDGAQDS